MNIIQSLGNTRVQICPWDESQLLGLPHAEDKESIREITFLDMFDAQMYLRDLSFNSDLITQLRDLLAREGLLNHNCSNDEVITQFATLLLQDVYRIQQVTLSQDAYGGSQSDRPADPPHPNVPPKPEPRPVPVDNPAKLVEFVEVIGFSDNLRVVTGAGPNSGFFQPAVKRVDRNKKTGHYKQFINLPDKNVDGRDQPHAEYGRSIKIKARVLQDGQPKAGESVVFSYKLEKGQFRPKLLAEYTESFGGEQGVTTHSAITGSDGWTQTVNFYFSAYASDAFTLLAKGPDGRELKLGSYEVWRKFWYQITHFKKTTPPPLKVSQKAYAAVFAEMVPATITKLNEQAVPQGSFYPEWMVLGGESRKPAFVVGPHNEKALFSLNKEEHNKPVKGHLVVCNALWEESKAPVAVESFQINSNPSELLTLNLQSRPNAGVLKPTLTGQSLVIYGEWVSKNGQKRGTLTDENILIEPAGRENFKQIKILLPKEAPDPAFSSITVYLQLRHARYLAGYSTGSNMLITHDKTSTAELFNNIVTHEFGHGFNQPPDPGKENPSLPRHPMQYIPQNSRGGHCRTGATKVTPDFSKPQLFTYKNGKCIMFSGGSFSSNGLFCTVCQPYIRLESMHEFS
jgi:hypothetical protein